MIVLKKELVIKPPKPCGDCQECLNDCTKSFPIPLAEAMEKLFSRLQARVSTEKIPLAEAQGRVTACSHQARLTIPEYDAAMKDGVAVAWQSLDEQPELPFVPLETGDYKIVPMGGRVEESFDTLLHAEQCQMLEDGRLRILERPVLGQCISWRGSALEEGEEIVPQGVCLQPAHLSMLRMGGVEEVEVYPKVRLGIIPIGNDLADAGTRPAPGKKPESNSIYVAAFAQSCGVEAEVYPLVEDDAAAISRSLEEALSACDMLAVIGGLGKGRSRYEDYVLQAVEEIGNVINHGVLVSPGGSPSLVAEIGGKAVLGIPGPPHAALIMTEVLLKPVFTYYGCPCPQRPQVQATLMENFKPRGKSLWYNRVHLAWNGQEYELYPLKRAGDTVDNFVRATGLLAIEPAGVYEKGMQVMVELL